MEPFVSVITIFLDEERFLAEAVQSVLDQTYDRWELLLCDDGSTDRSPAIARAYAERYPDRIRYLVHPGQENRGMSATRNLGIHHARGDLIAFLDADDVWLPEKLEREVDAMERHPAASMVVSPSLWWHSWMGGPEDEAHDEPSRMGFPAGRVMPGRKVLTGILGGSTDAISTCSMLVRREAVIGVGGFEERFTGLFEDQAFFAKVLLSHDVFVMDEWLAKYRQHPDSCCAMATVPVLAARGADYLEWLNAYVGSQPVDRALRWTLARERWIHRFPGLVAARIRAKKIRRTAYGRLVGFSFILARLVMPASARSWVYERLKRRRSRGRAVT
jgi:glycosyltransferase involved in cell wall biosynthesis